MADKLLGNANCSRISHDNTRATNPIESAVIEYWMAMTLASYVFHFGGWDDSSCANRDIGHWNVLALFL